MKQFPFLPATKWLMVLRVAVGLMLAMHGIIRIYAGTVGGFGDFLSDRGFPAGTVIAWVLTMFEIVGGGTLAAGLLKKIISLVFIVELLMGIVLVHSNNGWFVVGYSSGGAEYSVLLIICLLTVAAGKDN